MIYFSELFLLVCKVYSQNNNNEFKSNTKSEIRGPEKL